jgi:hypothetical protein
MKKLLLTLILTAIALPALAGNHNRSIFSDRGDYRGFIQNNSVFDENGDYRGFIQNNSVFDENGNYRAFISNGWIYPQ